MFVINDDNSIYATRGDIVLFSVTAEDEGVKYRFQPGDVVRIKVYGRKDAENVVLQKDFPVGEACDAVEIFLSEEDTKIGEVISKPADYWYEVELNPLTNPQTIIGYDEDGAKVFKLFPEGKDVPDYVPEDEEDIPLVDRELDLASPRPVENQAISKAFAQLEAEVEANKAASVAKDNQLHARLNDVAETVAMEQQRLDIIIAGSTIEPDAEVADIRVGADGKTYGSAGTAVREQIGYVRSRIEGENLTLLCEGVSGVTTSAFSKTLSGENVLKVIVGASNATAMKFLNTSGQVACGIYVEPYTTYYVSVSGDVNIAWTAAAAEANYEVYLVNNPSVALEESLCDSINCLAIKGEVETGSLVNGLYEWANGKWVANGWDTRLATAIFPRRSIHLTVSCDFDNGYQCSIVAIKGNEVVVDTGWNTKERTVTAHDCDGFYALVKRVVGGADVAVSAEEKTGLVVTELSSYPILATQGDLDEIRGCLVSNNKRYNPLAGNKYYAHLFLDTIWADKDPVFPSQSVFDVRCAHRLGFNVIEGNVHKTATEGKYIVMHGVNGTLGWQVKTVDDEWASDVVIADTSYEELRANYRYRSKYAKYRTPIASLEEFLLECKKLNITPFIQYVDEAMLKIVKEISGEDFILYQAPREKHDGMIFLWGSSAATKDDIFSICDTYGAPFMYGLAAPDNFTDDELKEIVSGVHQRGCLIGWAGCYCTPETNKKLLELGYDFSGSGWDVNDFESGNLLNAKGDVDYSDFTTTGTVSGGVLTLATGDTITVEGLPSAFLAKGSLHIVFAGAINLKMGDKINHPFTADGTSGSWFSTLFMEESPTFTLTATQPTRILAIDYKVSKC